MAITGTMVDNGNGTFTFTPTPGTPTGSTGVSGQSASQPNDDGTFGPHFTTEDDAFNAAKALTEIENLSYCSADLGDGLFAVVRNNSIGFNIKRCQPVIFAPGGAEDRDRQNLAENEANRAELERTGRLKPKSETEPEEKPEEPEPST